MRCERRVCSAERFDLRISFNSNLTSEAQRDWLCRRSFSNTGIFCISAKLLILCWSWSASSDVLCGTHPVEEQDKEHKFPV